MKSEYRLISLIALAVSKFAGDPQSRRSSNRLQLPAGWKWTTGASPGKSVELFVVSGEVVLGSMAVPPGGYAYIPPGFTGSNISTDSGAVVLWFLDDANPDAVIQTPLIMDSGLVDWRTVSDDVQDFGILIKELRHDPGSGARTWLLQITPGAVQGWQKSGSVMEGYLLSGLYRHSECVNGEVVSHDYTPGGYFLRPPGAVNGGPDAVATSSAIWYLRSIGKSAAQTVAACTISDP
jgi:hypothetical protein